MHNRNLSGGRRDAKRGERVNVDVFVFKLIFRVNIVIKISRIQIATSILHYENIF